MGMARHAPMTSEPRHFVTDHAVQRCREYVPGFGHLPDAHIRLRLDEVIIDAFARGVQQPVLDFKGENSWIVGLKDAMDANLFLLLKPFRLDAGGLDNKRTTVVTLLKDDMVERDKVSGRLVLVATPASRGTNGTKLGDKHHEKFVQLKAALTAEAADATAMGRSSGALVIATNTANGAPRIEARNSSGVNNSFTYTPDDTLSTNWPPPGVKPLGGTTSPSADTATTFVPPPPKIPDPLETRLVSWAAKDGKPAQAEFLAGELQQRLMALLAEGVPPTSIRAWKPVKLNLTISIAE